jgi:hypothetical protein
MSLSSTHREVVQVGKGKPNIFKEEGLGQLGVGGLKCLGSFIAMVEVSKTESAADKCKGRTSRMASRRLPT